ncbi:hypothetical protein Golomagni_03094, partial [Golovinomyces magnicellulatus]
VSTSLPFKYHNPSSSKPATIENTIKWREDSAIKYKNPRLQDGELWEISYDLNEAIATGVVDIETLKPTSDYKTALMDLRGVLRRNGVYICRKAGKKVTECFSEFLQTSANGTVPIWPLASLQSLINSEVTSITDIFLVLSIYIDKMATLIIKPSSINQPLSSISADDLKRMLGNIIRLYQGDDKKYGAWNDSLDYTMDMCKDICDINQCPVDHRIDGLMLALEEPALSEFRAHRHDVGMTFEGMINHLR